MIASMDLHKDVTNYSKQVAKEMETIESECNQRTNRQSQREQSQLGTGHESLRIKRQPDLKYWRDNDLFGVKTT